MRFQIVWSYVQARASLESTFTCAKFHDLSFDLRFGEPPAIFVLDLKHLGIELRHGCDRRFQILGNVAKSEPGHLEAFSSGEQSKVVEGAVRLVTVKEADTLQD